MAQQMRVLQHQQLSPEAEQLAGAYQLGTPQNEYRVGTKRWAIVLWVILGIFLGGGFVLGAFVAPDTSTMLILLILGLVLLGLGLYYIFLPLVYRSWRAYVCTDGFISSRGGKVEAFRWDQIEAMWRAVTRRYSYGIHTGTTHRYTVRRKDGVEVLFDDRFTNVEQLGDSISSAITNYLLPQVISGYKAGNTITFGPLSISTQGVSNGKELLPWSQIKEMGVQRGIVTVKKEGKWLSWSTIRAAKVPNIFVFMALVNYILKSQK